MEQCSGVRLFEPGNPPVDLQRQEKTILERQLILRTLSSLSPRLFGLSAFRHCLRHLSKLKIVKRGNIHPAPPAVDHSHLRLFGRLASRSEASPVMVTPVAMWSGALIR